MLASSEFTTHDQSISDADAAAVRRVIARLSGIWWREAEPRILKTITYWHWDGTNGWYTSAKLDWRLYYAVLTVAAMDHCGGSPPNFVRCNDPRPKGRRETPE